MESEICIVVTGGGSGIGKVIALKMAQLAPVMLVGRTEKTLRETCDEIYAQNNLADYFVGDISDSSVAKNCIQKVHDNGWIVRHLICNAGIGHGVPSEQLDPASLHETLAVNFYGNWYFVQTSLPDMLQAQTGTICLMSSVLSLHSRRRQLAYSASKSALNSLGQTLYDEYARKNPNIVVEVLCPDFIESPMTDQVIQGLMTYQHLTMEQARQRIIDNSSGHRIIPAEEIAEIVFGVCTRQIPSLKGEPRIIR